jgi:nucleotide-binding universal stress UspA family protein
MYEFNSLLVPLDFSPAADLAYERALQLASGENPFVILLHVIDSSVARFVADHDLASEEHVVQLMRARAETRLNEYRSRAPEGIDVQTIVAEGTPFLQILKKADEFQVDAVVMTKLGSRSQAESLLFGTTAERIVRGSTRPVIVLPGEK